MIASMMISLAVAGVAAVLMAKAKKQAPRLQRVPVRARMNKRR